MNYDKKNWQELVEFERGISAEERLEKRLEMKEKIQNATKEEDINPADIASKIVNRLTAKRVPFLDPNTKGLEIYSDDLVFIAAGSGKGKSTVAANIALSYTNEDKPVLIIATEESDRAVWQRIACLKLGINPNNLSEQQLTPEFVSKLEMVIKELSTKINVKSNTNTGIGHLNIAEVIEEIFKNSIGKYSAIIVDYYQNIDQTEKAPNDVSGLEAQKQFSTYCNTYKDFIGCPIFVMAQSHAFNNSAVRSDFQNSRQIGRKTMYQRATVAIELQRITDKPSGNAEVKVDLAEQGNVRDIILMYLHKSRELGLTGYAPAFRWERGFYKFVKTLTAEQVEQFDSKAKK